jgi:hypothetical protein
MKKRDWRSRREDVVDVQASREGFGLAVLAGRREWDVWCRERITDDEPESEWIALGGLLS